MKNLFMFGIFYICGCISLASMVGANDITVCKYQQPFRIERRMVKIEKVRQDHRLSGIFGKSVNVV